MKIVPKIFLAILLVLASFAPAAEAKDCGWYYDPPGTHSRPTYWCYTPDQGWELAYSMAEDMRLHALYGYDAYDGDEGYYTPQRFIRWDCIAGHGLLKEGC